MRSLQLIAEYEDLRERLKHAASIMYDQHVPPEVSRQSATVAAALWSLLPWVFDLRVEGEEAASIALCRLVNLLILRIVGRDEQLPDLLRLLEDDIRTLHKIRQGNSGRELLAGLSAHLLHRYAGFGLTPGHLNHAAESKQQ